MQMLCFDSDRRWNVTNKVAAALLAANEVHRPVRSVVTVHPFFFFGIYWPQKVHYQRHRRRACTHIGNRNVHNQWKLS